MAVKTYLTLYNATAMLSWCYLVFLIIQSLLTTPTSDSLPSKIYMYKVTMTVQTLAILEILHAALKWVKSPVLTTALQVVSRCAVIDVLGRAHMKTVVGQSTFIPLLLAW